MTSHPTSRASALTFLVAVALLLPLATPPAAEAVLVYAKGQDRAAIWVADDDGSGARKLADGASPRVAPDGRTVAFTPNPSDADPEVRVIPAAGGQARTVLRQWREDLLAWSPDSRSLAALTGPETGSRQLVLVDVASGRTRTIASGEILGASFSPSGDRLVYARSRNWTPGRPRSDLYVAPTDGGAPERLTTGGHSLFPVWGARAIAYVRQERMRSRRDPQKYNLWLIGPDGEQRRRLTRDRPPRLMSGLVPTAWSADGRRLLAQFTGQDTTWLVTVDPSSGRQATIGPRRAGTTGYTGVRLSRDGSTILAQRGGGPDDQRSDVIAVPYDGGTPEVLARDAFAPDWNR